MDKNNSWENEYDDFESWESDLYFIEKEDFEGLIKHRKKMLERYPNDSDTKWGLGEAYILNKEYDRALNYFLSIYEEEYENPNIQWSILDALYALGKNEDNFDWIEKPDVVSKSKATELCFEMMKNKRKRKSVHTIYCDLLIKGYLPFDTKDLYTLLTNDDRFDIEDDGSFHSALVKVKNKKDRIK